MLRFCLLLSALILPFAVQGYSQNDIFQGVAVVNNCSGALFKMTGVSPAQRALVITNGHCLNLKNIRGGSSHYPHPGEFLC